MFGLDKILLAMMTGLVLLMIVRDPHQAHRPPDLRIAAATTVVIETTTA